MTILQLGCYQMNIKKHVLYKRGTEVRVWESLLMLLALFKIADVCEPAVFIFPLLSLSENKQVLELFARMRQSLSNGCR